MCKAVRTARCSGLSLGPQRFFSLSIQFEILQIEGQGVLWWQHCLVGSSGDLASVPGSLCDLWQVDSNFGCFICCVPNSGHLGLDFQQVPSTCRAHWLQLMVLGIEHLWNCPQVFDVEHPKWMAALKVWALISLCFTCKRGGMRAVHLWKGFWMAQNGRWCYWSAECYLLYWKGNLLVTAVLWRMQGRDTFYIQSTSTLIL